MEAGLEGEKLLGKAKMHLMNLMNLKNNKKQEDMRTSEISGHTKRW